jgi:hypothetical protein
VGTLHEDQYTFLIISVSVLLRMRNVSDNGCRRNQNKHFLFFFFENRAVYVKSKKNNGYFTWRPIHIFIISVSVLLRMRNVSDNGCRGNQNKHFMFFLFENRAVYEIMWKKYCRAGQATDVKYGTCAFHAGHPGLQSLSLCVIILITFPL